MQHKQQQNVITLYALFGCKVARIEAAENQVILIGLTALRQSIRKAMEAITNQVKHIAYLRGHILQQCCSSFAQPSPMAPPCRQATKTAPLL